MHDLDIVILAAGKGTRMRSQLPKVLHTLAGKPMVEHVLATANGLNPSRTHVVIGHGADQLREALAEFKKFLGAPRGGDIAKITHRGDGQETLHFNSFS